jgi:hypothetical protein
MYKVSVKHSLAPDRDWVATIIVFLPTNLSADLDDSSLQPEYISPEQLLLGETLTCDWGEADRQNPGYRSKKLLVRGKTAASIEQLVKQAIFKIGWQLHGIVVSYRDKLDSAPADFNREIDPSLMAIPGGAFEVITDFKEWRKNLKKGDRLGFQKDGQWEVLKIADIADITDAEEGQEYEIVSSEGSHYSFFANQLFPVYPRWIYEISEGQILRVRSNPATSFQRVDRVRHVLHNWRDSQMLVTWESDKYQEIVRYGDVFGTTTADLAEGDYA